MKIKKTIHGDWVGVSINTKFSKVKPLMIHVWVGKLSVMWL